jgi:hypothetical protein
MNSKTVVFLEYKSGDNDYRFEIPQGAPIGEAYTACATILGDLANSIKSHSENVQPKNPDSEEDSSDEGSSKE